MRTRHRVPLTVFVALALIVAACGSTPAASPSPGPWPSCNAAIVKPFALVGVMTGKSSTSPGPARVCPIPVTTSKGDEAAPTMSYAVSEVPAGGPDSARAIDRPGPDVAFAANQNCGADAFVFSSVYEFPFESVTPLIGIRVGSMVARTIRLPCDGNIRFQVDGAGLISLVKCAQRTMRIPDAGGAVPAAAALRATDTTLKVSFAGVIAAVNPASIGAAAVWTKYSLAWCWLSLSPQAMSASSSANPLAGAKFVAALIGNTALLS